MGAGKKIAQKVSQFDLPFDLPLKRRGVTAYHGSTNPDLTELNSKRAVETPGTTWHSSDPDVAETFTVPREYGEPVWDHPRGAVYETQIAAKNPLELTGEAAQRFSDYNDSSVIEEARRKAHDLIIAKDVNEGIGNPMRSDVYAVLDDSIVKIIGKFGIVGALGAGLITSEQAKAAQAQGLGDPNTTPKGDRMQRSLEARKQEALARAQQGSARADQMATGGTGPSATVPLDYSGLGKSLATGTRNTLEAIPGMLGDVQEWSGKERWAPTSQQVGQFTDQFSPQWLQNLTRYKPQGPVEQGMAEVPGWWLG